MQWYYSNNATQMGPVTEAELRAMLASGKVNATDMICGVAGIVTCFLPGIAAVICGHMALKQLAVPNARVTGRCMAVAGLVLGYLSIVLLLALGALILLGTA